MGDVGMILLVAGVAAVVIGGAYWSWLQAKKRREALAALAAELGWSFDPTRDTYHDEEYAHFEIFRKGHSRRAYNTLRGEVEVHGRACPAKMGDFLYKVTSSSGKSTSTRTYRFSYLIIHLPHAGVPDLLIRREGILDKIAGAVGFDDIDFESAEFSKRFLVKSADKRFAYDVIDARMMEFLMATDPPVIDLEHGRLCISDARSRWSPDEFRSTLGYVGEFLGRWPEHVVASLEART